MSEPIFVVATIIDFDDGSVEANELHRGSLESCKRVADLLPAVAYNGPKKPKRGSAFVLIEAADAWDAILIMDLTPQPTRARFCPTTQENRDFPMSGAPGESVDKNPNIEVTPEMIEAGVLCFWEADRRVEEMETILERVFKVMIAARGAASSRSPFPS